MKILYRLRHRRAVKRLFYRAGIAYDLAHPRIVSDGCSIVSITACWL
jgi:hypothetical protein